MSKIDRVFRIDFYPQDWLTQTARMTLEQRGLFIQICAMIYANRGPIENDAAWIARASNCSTRLARTLIDQILSLGDLQEFSGKLTQKRCELELNSKRTHLENSSKGGRNSVEKRTQFNKNKELTSSEVDISLPSSHPSPHPVPSDTNVSDGELFKEPPKIKEPRKRRTVVPEDFIADLGSVALARELNIDVEKTRVEFIEYWRGEGGLKADWQMTFRRRLRQISEFRSRNSGGRSYAPKPTYSDDIQTAMTNVISRFQQEDNSNDIP